MKASQTFLPHTTKTSIALNNKFNYTQLFFLYNFIMEKYFDSLKQIDITQGFSPEKIFITSDLHLFHKNIIKYVNRPFDFSPEGCSKMNETLLKNFDELPEDCLIWNLGDVILNRNVLQEKTSAVIWRMKQNRKMNLILGNHDKQCKKDKAETFIDYFTKSGFDMVFNKPIIFNNKYIFSHEPVFIPQGSNFINIHGHTHNRFVTEDFFLSKYNKSFPKMKVNPKNYINVCMDANNFEILRLNELINF